MSRARKGSAYSESDLYPLVEAVYDAAVRPETWGDCLAKLCAMVGAQSSCLQIHDSSDDSGAALWWHGIPEQAIAQYPSWISANPHLKAIAPYLRTGLVVANTPVARSDFLKSEFFNGYGRLYFPTYAAGGGCVYGNGTVHVTLAVDRAVDQDVFDLGEGSIFALLMPHLQRAMVIHKRLGDADLGHASSLDSLNRLDFGVILLSRRGVVVEMNDAARAIVAESGALVVSGHGQLETPSIAHRRELKALVTSACTAWQQPLRPGGGALSLPAKPGSPPLELMATPLRLQAFGFTLDPPAAVLFLRDPSRSTMLPARLQQIYGLTAAEARVAQRLGRGESVTEASEGLQVSVSTVRTHVRRLLEKVGARNLSDLTRRIGGLAPIK